MSNATNEITALYTAHEYGEIFRRTVASIKTLLTVTPLAPARHYRDRLLAQGFQSMEIDRASACLEASDDLRFVDVDGVDTWASNLAPDIQQGPWDQTGWAADPFYADIFNHGARIGWISAQADDYALNLLTSPRGMDRGEYTSLNDLVEDLQTYLHRAAPADPATEICPLPRLTRIHEPK